MDSFIEQYRSLAVVSCEWRAFGIADPEVMADQVLVRWAERSPNLKEFYRALQKVVAQTYQNEASKKPILSVFMGSGPGLIGRQEKSETLEEHAGDALRALRSRETEILQARYWDELTPTETAEITRSTTEKVEELTQSAKQEFAARLRRRLGVHAELVDQVDIEALIRKIKPGVHHRFGDDLDSGDHPEPS